MYTAVKLYFTPSVKTTEFSEEDISLPTVSSLFERGGRGEKCLQDVNQEQTNHRDGKSVQGTLRGKDQVIFHNEKINIRNSKVSLR